MSSRRAQGTVHAPVQRQDGTWSCRIRYPAADGRRLTDYAQAASKGEALRLAQMLLARRLREEEEVRAGVRLTTAGPAPTLEELAVRCSREYLPTRQAPAQRIRTLALLRRWWVPPLGATPITHVDVSSIRRTLAAMRERGRSAATCNRALSALAVVVEFARELGVIATNPIRGARLAQSEGRKVPRYLHADEAARLIAAAEWPWQALFAMAIYTGMRFGELAALRWRDVDLERGLIHVRASNRADRPKSGHERTVGVPAELRPLIVAHAQRATAVRPEHLVFVGRRQGGRRPDPTADQVSIPRKALQRALEAAGIDQPITMHCLRHTFATLLLDAGASQRHVQDALGHSSLAMTSRYVHVTGARPEIRLERKPDPDPEST